MHDPITELPWLEATLWESATDAAVEAAPIEFYAELLVEFGYELTLAGGVLTLRHVGTGQVMRRRVG